MLQRQKGEIVFECDLCGEMLDTHTSNFTAAKNLLDREGWRSHKDEDIDEWQHFCPRCR